LMAFLGLDSEVYTVSLQALWSNCSTNILCHLKDLEHTS
jgi:hypothetical protein